MAAGERAALSASTGTGPGRLDYGIYDHGCLDYGYEFGELVSNNKGLVGYLSRRRISAGRRHSTNCVRDCRSRNLQAGYETGRKLATGKVTADTGVPATLALGEPEAALAQLFAAVEKSPDDAGTLFNLAAALSIDRLPNESLAAIAHIRSLGKLPALPLGVDAAAALDYQEGYARMLRGDLGAAKSGFQKAMAQEPFINESAHGLALVQASRRQLHAGQAYVPRRHVAVQAEIPDRLRRQRR